MRRFLVAVFLLALAGCGSGAAMTTPDGDTGAPSATPAPELMFDLPTVDGGRLDGTTLAGQDLALWFWAPWCPTCNAEAPEVAAAAASAPDGVEIVGVAGRDELPPMREFVERHDLSGLRHVADTGLEVWDAFGIPVQPAWVFVDGQTGEVERVLGPLGEGLNERLSALAG